MASITEEVLESRLEDDGPPDRRPRIESGDDGDKSFCEGGNDGDRSVCEGGNDGIMPDDDYDSEPEIPEELAEKYVRQVRESECFEVDHVGRYLMCGMVAPLSVDDEKNRDWALPFAKEAIKQFNEKENANFEFVRLVFLTVRVIAGIILYITFEAKDAAGQIKTFQAQVLDGIREKVVQFCRLKPAPKQGSESEPVGQGSACCCSTI